MRTSPEFTPKELRILAEADARDKAQLEGHKRAEQRAVSEDAHWYSFSKFTFRRPTHNG